MFNSFVPKDVHDLSQEQVLEICRSLGVDDSVFDESDLYSSWVFKS